MKKKVWLAGAEDRRCLGGAGLQRYNNRIPYRKIDAFVRAGLYCPDRPELPRGESGEER